MVNVARVELVLFSDVCIRMVAYDSEPVNCLRVLFTTYLKNCACQVRADSTATVESREIVLPLPDHLSEDRQRVLVEVKEQTKGGIQEHLPGSCTNEAI